MSRMSFQSRLQLRAQPLLQRSRVLRYRHPLRLRLQRLNGGCVLGLHCIHAKCPVATFGAQKRFVLSSCAIFSIGDRALLWLPRVSFSPAPQLQAKFDVLLSDKVFPLRHGKFVFCVCILTSVVGKNGRSVNGLIPHQQQLLWVCGSVPGVP